MQQDIITKYSVSDLKVKPLLQKTRPILYKTEVYQLLVFLTGIILLRLI